MTNRTTNYFTSFAMTHLMHRVQMKGNLRNSISFQKKPYELTKDSRASIVSALSCMLFY